MKIYLFLFYSCCSFFLAARGQLSTIPTILLPNDSVNISFRLNMCNEVNRVMDGSVSLSNVLKGKNVSFGIRQSTWPSKCQLLSITCISLGLTRSFKITYSKATYKPGFNTILKKSQPHTMVLCTN